MTADASGLLSGVQKALGAIDKLGAGFKKLARETGQLSAAITGFGTLMVYEAAKYDRQVARAVKDLQGAYSAMAVEIARTLLPIIRDLTHFVSGLVRWFRDLSPEVRAQAAHFAALAASLLATTAVIGKVGDAIADLAGLAAALLPALPIILAIGAGLVLMVTIMTALDLTWTDAWDSIRSTSATSWNWLGENFNKMIHGMVDNIGMVVRFWMGALVKMFEAARPLMKLLGMEDTVDLNVDMAKWIAGLTTVEGFQSLIDDAKSTATGVIDRLKEIPSKMKDLLKSMGLDIDAFMKGGPKVSAGRSIADQDKLAALIAQTEKNQSGGNVARGTSGGFGTGATKERAKAIDAEIKFANDMAQALTVAGTRLMNKMGRAGEAAGSVMQGFAAGGPWGAVIAAFGELIGGSKQFEKIMERVNVGFDMLSDLFGEIIAPLEDVVLFLNGITRAISGPLKAAFKKIGQFANWLFETLYDVTKFLAAGVVGVAILIYKVVRWFVEAWYNLRNWLADTIVNISKALLPEGPLRTMWEMIANNLRMTDDALQGVTVTIQTLEGAYADIVNSSWKAIVAAEKKAEADEKATKAANALTESLTNVPTGFKTAARRHESIASDAGGGIDNFNLRGGSIGRPGGMDGAASMGPAPTYITINVGGSVVGAKNLAQYIDDALRTRRAQRTGLLTQVT